MLGNWNHVSSFLLVCNPTRPNLCPRWKVNRTSIVHFSVCICAKIRCFWTMRRFAIKAEAVWFPLLRRHTRREKDLSGCELILTLMQVARPMMEKLSLLLEKMKWAYFPQKNLQHHVNCSEHEWPLRGKWNMRRCGSPSLSSLKAYWLGIERLDVGCTLIQELLLPYRSSPYTCILASSINSLGHTSLVTFSFSSSTFRPSYIHFSLTSIRFRSPVHHEHF